MANEDVCTTDIDTDMAAIDLGADTSPSVPVATPAVDDNRHRSPGLLDLPVELRLQIYEHLTKQPLELVDISAIAGISPDDVLINHAGECVRTRDLRTSYSWLFTCQKIFDEGKDEILKTHIIGFRTQDIFSTLYVSGMLRNIRAMAFRGFSLSLSALRYAKHVDEMVAGLEVVCVYSKGRWTYERVD